MESNGIRGETVRNYGATFRTFRQNKGYTLQQVATGIVSVSFLSKFERGDSDISFSVMVELLDRIMVTFEEFYFLHNEGKSHAIEEFFNAAEKAYIHRDLITLNELKAQALRSYQSTNHIPFHCNALLLDVYQAMIQKEEVDVTDDSLQLLMNYLFDIEVWGYYELSLYNSTLFLLPPESVITFSETIYKKSVSMNKLPLVHNIFIRILLNTITYLTGGKDPHFAYEQECRTFMDYLKQSDIPERDLHARIAFMQAQGYVDVRIGNIKRGVNRLERAIAMYEELGADELAWQSSSYLNIFLNKSDTER